MIASLLDKGIKNWAVLDVMRTTPRHIFLDEALAHRAYEDTALPIGFSQTISQPYVVARMTEAVLAGRSGRLSRVLEIGTGCGYQTAIIAQLADRVWSVERIQPLLDKARKNLGLLKIRNVRSKHDDGSLGWPEYGPFDAIIAAAAPQQVPEELLQQLADGGRLVIPVGSERGGQELRLIERSADEFHTQILEAVNFVPLYLGQVQY
ncbi:protein-L-isoaspartate O-methyltransferase [Pseudohongiella spirulinae]|uniref:Protein-L-isoaspartate O-methyltransferase n=2 Tax=Pseudohongiella spirulinae TaxID=1249552 RepID=A0A0S2KD73_9GAMM|nr:protein-L-isoaspartate O-methyltransferase [Pseudohongiella spirulinae]